MPNIIKALKYVILLGFFSFQANGQKIIESSDIQVNGDVYGVKKVNIFGNHYALCGNFTSISSTTSGLNNLAFIDPTTFQSENFSFISSINGPINDIAAVTVFDSFTMNYYIKLYIAGAFDTINGSARNGAACFSVPLVIGNSINDLSLTSWDPGFHNGVNVHDVEIKNDTVYMAGDFFAVNNYTTADDERPGIAAFNAQNGNDLNMFNLNAFCNSDLQSGSYTTYNIELTENKIVLSGTYHPITVTPGSYIRFNYNGCYDQNFGLKVSSQYAACCYHTGGYDIAVANDTVYCGVTKLGPSDPYLWFYTDTTNYNSGPSTSILPQNSTNNNLYNDSPPPTGGTTFEYTSVAAYKDQIFATRKVNYPTSGPIPLPQSTLIGIDSSGTFWAPWDMTTNFTDINNEHIFVEDNVLFASENGTINFSPYLRTGIIIFCLEPHDPEQFTVFDTTICQSDTITYSISAVDYADGYEWSFSNQNADLDTSAFVSNSFVSNQPSLDIRFLDSFTSGTLTVTPFSTCTGNTTNFDTVYSKPISIDIGLNPLPNLHPLQDTTLTCYVNTIDLIAQSDTPNVNYYWNSITGNQFTQVDSQIFPIAVPDTFFVKVEDSDGCLNFDTLVVDTDTIKPNFAPMPGPFVLTCVDTIVTANGFCNNFTDTLSWWQKIGNSDTLANPLQTSSLGEHRFYTQNLVNGCIDSVSILVEDGKEYPEIGLVGYPDTLSSLDAYDTLNCFVDSLNLECYSVDSNSTVNWIDTANQVLLGTNLWVNSAGFYYVHAVNDTSGCEITKSFKISEDYSLPINEIDTSTLGKLNCSNDSLVLSGSSPTPNTSTNWTGNSIPTSPNPITVNAPGYYIFNVTNNDNGCTAKDSIEIIQDNSIEILTSSDTFACDQDQVTVSANHIGNITGSTYSWDNGNLGTTANYIANGSYYAVLEVNGDGGCYGIDSIRIETPPNPNVNFQGFQPCGPGSYGSIVASPVSGWAPFEYSIDDGLNYQTSTTLDSLDLGTYSVWVKDSLNCEYQFQAAIDQTSQVSTPTFLVSTYNQQTDTLIAIDVSSPSPDSISWDFPVEIELIGDEDGSPLFILPDTGSFDLTMNAFYGTCESSLTKQIFVSEFDPNAATLYNQNGIDTTIVYPNPNDGLFNLEVILHKSQRVNIQVVDIMGLDVIPPYEYINTDHIQEQIVLPAAIGDGTYYVKVIAEFDSDYVQFVINN